jgi:hypothetical protein
MMVLRGVLGGVKRPHSVSSTPSQEKQLPKKPRNTQVQTGTFKEAELAIKMAIIHNRHPDVKLEQTQVDIIQTRIVNALDRTPSGETPPQFLYSKFVQGIFWITCANESSQVWLMRTISELGELWEGAELTVVNSKDISKRPSVLICIPDTSEITTVMTRLRIQNPELNTADWSVMSCKVNERDQMLVLSIDPDSFKAFWGIGAIIFRTLKDEKIELNTENTTGKPTPQ